MLSRIKVITPAVETDFVEIADVKSYLGITDNSQDALLTTLISAVSQSVTAYCNRQFFRETVEEIIRTTRRLDEICLGRFPLNGDITSISKAAEDLDADTYIAEDETGLIFYVPSTARCPWPIGEYTVTYTYGWDDINSVPANLRWAVLNEISHLKSQSKRDPRAKSVNVPGVMSVDYWVGALGAGSQFSPETQGILDTFKSKNI